MWIFGYGSLVWRPDIQYITRLEGHIKGFLRRFWQLSEDHRGVPGKPGRVVTLVPTNDQSDCVYGVAYEVSNEDEASVRHALDEREKDGYTIIETTFYPTNEKHTELNCYTYMAQANNPFWAGEAPLNDIAQQIAGAHGPSGSNKDYLFNLADAIRNMTTTNDEHLYELERLVKDILNH